MFEGLFIADLHYSKARREPCLQVLEKAHDFIMKTGDSGERCPLFICGDFFDSAMTATDNSGYADALDMMDRINYRTDVFMVYGTPTHEPSGILKAFECMKINVFDKNTYKVICSGKSQFELVALPEPRKSRFISKVTDEKTVNDLIIEDLENFTDKVFNEEKVFPRIVIGHGEIRGVSYSNAVLANSPIAFPPSTLKKLNADFYGFGHIHQKQEVFKNCWYIGSPYQKSFSETHEPSMMYVKIK